MGDFKRADMGVFMQNTDSTAEGLRSADSLGAETWCIWGAEKVGAHDRGHWLHVCMTDIRMAL